MKTYFMVQDVSMLEMGTVPGYVFVLDMKGFTYGHLARMKLSYMKLYAKYIQVSVCSAFDFGYLTTNSQVHT
jgi:hypothetical protein